MNCRGCGRWVDRPAGHVGRSESCPHCLADLHACAQCEHHDRSAANECTETQAEPVRDKAKANFCGFFVPWSVQRPADQASVGSGASQVGSVGGAIGLDPVEEKRRKQREAAEALFRRKT